MSRDSLSTFRHHLKITILPPRMNNVVLPAPLYSRHGTIRILLLLFDHFCAVIFTMSQIRAEFPVEQFVVV